MSHASLSSLKEKEKEKEIQKKRNIKSRKIDKRKRKMLVSEAFHNTHANHCGILARKSNMILSLTIGR